MLQRKENLKMSSCVLQYPYIHAVNLPLAIFTIRENNFSNHTALHNTYKRKYRVIIIVIMSDTWVWYLVIPCESHYIFENFQVSLGIVFIWCTVFVVAYMAVLINDNHIVLNNIDAYHSSMLTSRLASVFMSRFFTGWLGIGHKVYPFIILSLLMWCTLLS